MEVKAQARSGDITRLGMGELAGTDGGQGCGCEIIILSVRYPGLGSTEAERQVECSGIRRLGEKLV